MRVFKASLTCFISMVLVTAIAVTAGLSYAHSYKYQYKENTPVICSSTGTGLAAASVHRRGHTENLSFLPLIFIVGYLFIFACKRPPCFKRLTPDVILSPWLVCGKIAIPARAAPRAFFI